MGARFLRAGAAVAVLVLASVAVASAGSSTSQRAAHEADAAPVVLKLVGKASSPTVYVDLGAPDYSMADQYVLTNDLLRGDTKVGEDGAVCTVTQVEASGASTLYCSGSNSLPGGQITTAGLVTYGPDEEWREEPYYFAITGGTGKYKRARGQVKIKELGTTEHFRLTFRIVR